MIANHGECKSHEYQDQTYGKNNRVMNPVMENGKVIGARCTVCMPPKEKMKKRGGIFLLSQLKVIRS